MNSFSFRIGLLLGVLFFVSCKQEKVTPNILVQNIDIRIEESSNIKMSDYFSSIEYVQLETPQEKPIGSIFKIIERDEKLFLFDRKRNSIWLFDNSGNYLNEIIIPIGRGPGEVEYLADVFVSKNLMIHALGQLKIVVYDLNGNFKEDVNLDFNPFYLYYDTDLELYSGYVATMLNPKVDEKFKNQNILFFDKTGEIKNGALKIREGAEGIRFNIPNYFTEYKGNVFFSPHIQDTIYSYEGGKFEPRYFLNFFENSITSNTLSKRYDYSKVIWDWGSFWDEEVSNKGLISNVTFYEFTEQYIFLRVGNRYSQHMVVFDRNTKKVKVGGNKFINDLDLGPSPFIFSSSDDYLISYVESNDFTDHFDLIEADTNNDLYLNALDFSKSINRDGNPVLVKYYLKNE